MISIRYKVVRFFLYPIIYLADFMQNNFTYYFTPMNMGPITRPGYINFIKKNFSKNDYVLDFACGAGYFSSIFNEKKYLGVEINKNFVSTARKKHKKYKFKILNKSCLDGYKNKINSIFINNVLHHLTDDEINEVFVFFAKKLRPGTKIFIVEPLLPKKFFSSEFFMKVVDIGENMKTKKEYLKVLKQKFFIKKYKVKLLSIDHALVLSGFLMKN